MQRLYFVRHGQSEDNAAKVWSSKHTPLTALGREQAVAAGQETRTQGLVFDTIISSPLPRARETAELIAAQLGYSPDTIEIIEDLQERGFGSLVGTPGHVIFGKPYTRAAVEEAPGAEKIADLQQRAAQVLELLKQRPEDRILVVGHGSFGRALRRVLNDQPPTDEHDEAKVAQLYIQNAQIVRLI